jgi:hypothetical protein
VPFSVARVTDTKRCSINSCSASRSGRYPMILSR